VKLQTPSRAGAGAPVGVPPPVDPPVVREPVPPDEPERPEPEPPEPELCELGVAANPRFVAVKS
jgi:hypothetical protein